jgi:hypothetical protein
MNKHIGANLALLRHISSSMTKNRRRPLNAAVDFIELGTKLTDQDSH